MSKIVRAGDAEYILPADINRLGEFPRDALDAVVGGAIGYPAHWAAITVSKKSAQEITISPGSYFAGEIIYQADDSQDLNLTLYLPLSASDEKWVAIIARGNVRTIGEDRARETSMDPETRNPVSASLPVIEARELTFVVQQGVANPAPAQQPTIADTDACVAYVRLTTTGIQDIAPGAAWRVKTLYEVEGRVTAIELRVNQLFEETTSIRTDVANLAAGQKNIPDPRLVAQAIRDIARHNQYLNMPPEARNYFFDQALLQAFWDFTKGGIFRVKEGIRFQYATQREQVLRLMDYQNPDLTIWEGQMVMPKYTEVTRITSPEGTGRKDISNEVHTVTTAVQHTISHESVRYGPTVNVCENTAGWGAVGSEAAGAIFQANGEQWTSYGATDNPWNQTATAQNGHTQYAVAQVIVDSWLETYTTYNTEQFGLSGAICGQTFLSSQIMVITSIDLNFTKVDPEGGDVVLCLCEVNAVGAPAFDNVITKMTKPRADLKVGWNKFTFKPALADQGKRLGWFTVTSGNHQLMSNAGNAYTGGSSFICTDGIWSQVSVTEDYAFRVNAAKFVSNRTVVPFESIGPLQDGMTEIQLIYKKWAPAATSLVWEVRAQGDDQWIPIDARADNPLLNLPPNLQLRAVFIGTPDVAPAIVLDQYARALAGRMRPDMIAISKLQQFGFATNEAQVVLQMDNFKSAKHTATPKLMLANDTVVTASSIISEVDPTKATRTKLTAHFDLPAGTTQARVRIDATTTSVIDVPFGQDVQLNAY